MLKLIFIRIAIKNKNNIENDENSKYKVNTTCRKNNILTTLVFS